MFKNYFKTAWRSISKNKFYSLLNISGLAVGLATGMMLLMWIQNEVSFDRFHKNYKDIYQLSAHFNAEEGGQVWRGVPGPLAVLARSVPGVKSIVRINEQYNQVLANKSNTKIFNGNTLAAVDPAFFSLFSFPLREGNKASLFPNLNSVVLTQATAKKIFGNEDAIGKSVLFNKENFVVTGVLQDFPNNSSMQYDAVFPMAYYAKLFTENGGNGDWKTIDEDLGDYSFITYVQLDKNANPTKVGDHFSKDYKKIKEDSGSAFQLESLSDIHLVSADGNNAPLRMVQIFMLVAVLLLSIASINYVNLSTARSLVRAKEVSIRKMVGAKKNQLFFQFIFETCLLFCFATVLAVVLFILLMPLYNSISGEHFSFQWSDPDVLKAAAIVVLGTLVASSIYPAILLSSFKPIQALKGKITSGVSIASLRKGLVVFQFCTSVVLLVCTIAMSSQLSFIRSKDLGYDKSYIFSVSLPDEAVTHVSAIKAELKQQPGILNVALSDADNIANIGSSTGDLYWEGKPANNNPIITQVVVDNDFIPAMKMKLTEGNNFSGTPSDTSYYILNETAVKTMGLQPPYVGKQIGFHSWKGTIKGVVKDFNFKSVKEKITPLIFFTGRWAPGTLYIRTTAANAQEAIAAAKQQYKKYAGAIPFNYSFLDQRFDEQYKTDERTRILFNAFAGVAIFISCLGLFGLATYTAQVKVKEIGIRKVLGASVAGIVTLISKDFLKLILLSVLIAIPIAWWSINQWLQGFVYRISISWWMFALPGIVIIVISIITMSFQAIKAAVANPIKSLRTE